LRQPVIAAIRGDAIGLGLELALACDLRVGTEKTRLGLPQVQYGQMPCNGGTTKLPRLVGFARGLQMILTGELICAEEALRFGLIHRIVTSENLIQEAVGLAREMSEKSPVSLSYARKRCTKVWT
jgi:enoyl-CoA hydratase/carnithine racemase